MNIMNATIFSMKKSFLIIIAGLVIIPLLANECAENQKRDAITEVTIVGEQFFINGEPTYKGRTWTTSYGGEYRIEGLLMNARLVQGIFDDLNPDTRGQWAYPDTKKWDPDRNTQEYIEAMASWRENGLLAFTLNLQGGCPYGYCRRQPWDNSAFAPDGSLREGFMNRLERVLNRADELGMVVILGYYYFGQDENVEDEAAIIRSVENATRWVLEKGYRNVLVEINNECSVAAYDHEILKCHRVHELIQVAKDVHVDGRRLYVSTSLAGGHMPTANIVGVSDYVLLHGNGVRDPERMAEMVREVREMEEYTPMPIVNNEDDRPWLDDHQGFGESGNNFVACVKNYASWGYFDFRRNTEHNEYNLGYQSIPVNWHITTEREYDFFDLCSQITGFPGTPKMFLDTAGESGKGTVRIEGKHPKVNIENVYIIVNNKVAATLTKEPYDFHIKDLPEGEHWVKARTSYKSGDTEIIIESLYHQNPWWPYGGPQ
jgi:hypothetical protein